MPWMDRTDLFLACVQLLLLGAGRTGSARVSRWVATAIAALACATSTKRALTAERIAAATDMDPLAVARRRLVQATFLTFWLDLFELASQPDRRGLTAAAQVHGLMHLQAAQAAGRGAILLESSAFGWRHGAKAVLYDRGFAVHQLHAYNHLLGQRVDATTRLRRRLWPALEAWERRVVAEIIVLPEGDSMAFTRRLLAILRQNGVLCLAGDGAMGQKQFMLPLLGELRPFATGSVSLARLSGAPLLPLFCWQAEDGVLQLAIEPPLELGADRAADQAVLGAFAQRLESFILRFPGQYRRWRRAA